VASVGAKLAPRWAFPVNFVVRRQARPYMTTFRGLDRPWRDLERYTDEMGHRSMALGGAYLAWGSATAKGLEQAAETIARHQ
jgi:hypothetical protein